MTRSGMHDVYNAYGISISGLTGLVVTHEACGLTVLTIPEAYLSYITRSVEQHEQVCVKVNGEGQHAAPF